MAPECGFVGGALLGVLLDLYSHAVCDQLADGQFRSSSFAGAWFPGVVAGYRIHRIVNRLRHAPVSASVVRRGRICDLSHFVSDPGSLLAGGVTRFREWSFVRRDAVRLGGGNLWRGPADGKVWMAPGVCGSRPLESTVAARMAALEATRAAGTGNGDPWADSNFRRDSPAAVVLGHRGGPLLHQLRAVLYGDLASLLSCPGAALLDEHNVARCCALLSRGRRS